MTPQEALTQLMCEIQQIMELVTKLTGLAYLDDRIKRLNEAYSILAEKIAPPIAKTKEDKK